MSPKSLNSTMVRLILNKNDLLNTVEKKSQFHYGSIDIKYGI